MENLQYEYEKRTTAELLCDAALLAAKKGYIDEKSLARKANINASSAAKLIAALRICGVLGNEVKHGYEYLSMREFAPKDSRLIVEKVKDASSYGKDFLSELLLPSVKVAIEWGNIIGVNMLERKLGLGYYRAIDLFDLLDAAGIIGEESYVNPGRRNLTITSADFDALIKRMGGER